MNINIDYDKKRMAWEGIRESMVVLRQASLGQLLVSKHILRLLFIGNEKYIMIIIKKGEMKISQLRRTQNRTA